jgi:precorrin-4 methylase
LVALGVELVIMLSVQLVAQVGPQLVQGHVEQQGPMGLVTMGPMEDKVVLIMVELVVTEVAAVELVVAAVEVEVLELMGPQRRLLI